MTSHERLVELIAEHSEFVVALETDPLGTLREEGFDDLVASVEAERDRIGELIDQIYRDEEFRRAIEDDPRGELGEWGLPELAIEPVLVLAGAPDEVIERATDDVEAHMRKPATIAALAAVLGTLAFAQQATAASQPQVSAQVAAQSIQTAGSTTQRVQAQITQQGGATAQKKRQGVQPARTAWQGVQAAQARGQGSSLLRAQAHRR